MYSYFLTMGGLISRSACLFVLLDQLLFTDCRGFSGSKSVLGGGRDNGRNRPVYLFYFLHSLDAYAAHPRISIAENDTERWSWQEHKQIRDQVTISGEIDA